MNKDHYEDYLKCGVMPGEKRRKWGQPRFMEIGNASAGIRIEHIKSRRVLRIGGWFDHIVGIESVEVPVEEFKARLNIR